MNYNDATRVSNDRRAQQAQDLISQLTKLQRPNVLANSIGALQQFRLGNLPRLAVRGSQLVDDRGQKAMLRGMSTHGIHWFPQYVNKGCFQTLKDQWHTNVVRLAMYVEEGGYTTDGRLNGKSFAKMIEGIDACIALGLYCIVDWHVSNADQTPRKHWGEAREFFASVSGKYGNSPNLLYEICNEPNNAGNDYASQIADYADDMIRTIRANAPDAVVIIGSGQWSKNCVEAWQFDKGRNRTNVLYTLHRYCDGDFDNWSPAIRAASLAGCPIIATECGVSNSGEWDWNTQDEFQKIIRLYEELGISWQVWSLADKVEPSSVLAPNAPTDGNWTDAQISKAGHLVKDAFWHYADKVVVDPQAAPVPPPKFDLPLIQGQFYPVEIHLDDSDGSTKRTGTIKIG